MDNNAINRARVVYYGLFSSLFSFNMGAEKYATIVEAIDVLLQSPIDEHSEKALSSMQRRLISGKYTVLKAECDKVFFSPTSTCIPMTASHYHELRDDGHKRVEMVTYVLESKFRRNAEVYKEHEDHIEFVMQFLQALIIEELQGDASASILATKVFTHILNGMIDSFTANLFNQKQSPFYRQVGLALRSFIDFERLYLNIPRPEQKKEPTSPQTGHGLDKEKNRKCVQQGSTGCV